MESIVTKTPTGSDEKQLHATTYSQLSTEALVEACAANVEAAAWEEFMRRYHRLIAGVVYRAAQQWGQCSSSMMDDLIQETYLKICADGCRLLRGYDPKHPDSIYGYLKVIAANVVHDRFKSLHTEKRGGNQIAEDLSVLENRVGTGETLGSQSAMEREILLSEIDVLLQAGLSDATRDRDRTIFWLYYRQGLTTKAIATLPGVRLTIKGVESTLLRLTRMVRGAMVKAEIS